MPRPGSFVSIALMDSESRVLGAISGDTLDAGGKELNRIELTFLRRIAAIAGSRFAHLKQEREKRLAEEKEFMEVISEGVKTVNAL